MMLYTIILPKFEVREGDNSVQMHFRDIGLGLEPCIMVLLVYMYQVSKQFQGITRCVCETRMPPEMAIF